MEAGISDHVWSRGGDCAVGGLTGRWGIKVASSLSKNRLSKRGVLVVAMSACIAALSIGHAVAGEQDVIGRWLLNRMDRVETVEFFRDKTCLISSEDLAGRWSILDDGRIKVDLTVLGTSSILLGTFEAGRLAFTLRGSKSIYVRENSIDGKSVRAVHLLHQKRYAEAETLFKEAVAGGSLTAMNNLAWMYATVADPRYQKGHEAVGLARKALAASQDAWRVNGTLAAALARSGKYEEAASAQRRALQLFDQSGNKDAKARGELVHRLQLYGRQQPYSE